ncbi:hypothetical protein A2U01_0093705, partial [Trifolium medium]|nr:hypothetical protein [Trifolium medium]
VVSGSCGHDKETETVFSKPQGNGKNRFSYQERAKKTGLSWKNGGVVSGTIRV